MTASELLKLVGIGILVLAAGFVQVTFSVLEINSVVPNLILIVVFTISFLDLKWFSALKGRTLFAAFTGGLLLDVFSTLPLGTEALMLVVMILVVEQILCFLGKINFLVYSISFIFFLVIYQIIFSLLSVHFLQLSWITLVYNFSIATLFYLLCFLTTFKEK